MIHQERLLLLDLVYNTVSQKVSQLKNLLCVCAIFVRRKSLYWCSKIDMIKYLEKWNHT